MSEELLLPLCSQMSYRNLIQSFGSSQIPWIINGPSCPKQCPGCQLRQLCCLSLGHTRRGFQDPSSLSKLFFKTGNFVTMGMKEHWSSTSCLSGVWLLQGRGDPLVRWLQRTRLLGHWLMLKIIIRTLVPAHFEVLKIKIPMTARPEKSKDLKQSLKTLAKSEKQ